ncbi:MAG: hypothetical protein LBD16_00205 [Oscillospiraceae bacterium]|jgi:hypothetical protein|nr:hypothetical protein [Oscillospiraceae bacterium]
MMKPDAKVIIAWGTQTQYNFAQKLKNKLDGMRKVGYPVHASTVCQDGDSTPVEERALKEFTNFDFAVFLFGIKSFAVTPKNAEMIDLSEPISTDMDDLINPYLKKAPDNRFVNDIAPVLSQNICFEFGLAKATHREAESIIWVTMGGNVQKYFPSDWNKPLIINLDKYDSDEKKLDYITAELHNRIRKMFGFLGQKHDDIVMDILQLSKYRPDLANVTSRKHSINIDFLGSYNSPLDAYFREEYEMFYGKPTSADIGRRVQYFIDRAVLFVYLRNGDFWDETVNALLNACYGFSPAERTHPLAAINILKEVMRYHNMTSKPSRVVDYNSILNKLLAAKNNVVNPMLKCLLEDYLGLCYHKITLPLLAKTVNKNRISITSKEDITLLRDNGSASSVKEACKNLEDAVACFSEVLRLSNENEMENFYIWEGFAQYNRARCLYMLNLINPALGQNWKDELQTAVITRRETAEKYEKFSRTLSFPVVISHNLRAEYFHAEIERFSYLNAQESADFDISDFEKVKTEIHEWGKKSSFYTDVLRVTESLNKLSKAIDNT